MLSGSSCVCVHRSELDVTVVDLLRKLEPALWEPAVLKFQSVTTWATIRNKSGFVTAEMQKLRTNWNQQQPLQKREEYTGGGAPDSTPLAASSDAPAPLALSSPSAAVHSNGRNSWAAAVRPGETARVVQQPQPQPQQEPERVDYYPAHALVERLTKELASIPGGKQTRRERKRLTQRVHEAEHTDAYVAESAVMAAASGGSTAHLAPADANGYAAHAYTCVKEQYGVRVNANAVSSRFVTLVPTLDVPVSPIGIARPLLYDGTLLTVVHCLPPYVRSFAPYTIHLSGCC